MFSSEWRDFIRAKDLQFVYHTIIVSMSNYDLDLNAWRIEV